MLGSVVCRGTAGGGRDCHWRLRQRAAAVAPPSPAALARELPIRGPATAILGRSPRSSIGHAQVAVALPSHRPGGVLATRGPATANLVGHARVAVAPPSCRPGGVLATRGPATAVVDRPRPGCRRAAIPPPRPAARHPRFGHRDPRSATPGVAVAPPSRRPGGVLATRGPATAIVDRPRPGLPSRRPGGVLATRGPATAILDRPCLGCRRAAIPPPRGGARHPRSGHRGRRSARPGLPSRSIPPSSPRGCRRPGGRSPRFSIGHLGDRAWPSSLDGRRLAARYCAG